MSNELLSSEDNVLDFNFWPAFADLMLSLVLILIIILFLFFVVITAGTVNLNHVKHSQMEMVSGIAAAYGLEAREQSPNNFSIDVGIEIHNEPTLQRISFTDKILFPPDEYRLSDRGGETLKIVGSLLKQKLAIVREIQIQGHADTDRTFKYPSNVDLAASRAITVYKFMQEQVGIDPSEHLMSATSFGEFKPVSRLDGDMDYNEERLARDNGTRSLKDRNRRIELLLFYSVELKESGELKEMLSVK